MNDRAKVLYVPKDGGHHHDGMGADYHSEHSHPNLEREVQIILDDLFAVRERMAEYIEQIAILHARIDELELLIPE